MRAIAAIAAVGLVLAGCGSTHRPPLSAECVGSPSTIETAALRGAALPDGTRLSECVADAHGDGDIEDISAVFLSAAADLAAQARGSGRAARGLGFLIGATQRSADPTDGVAAQLGQHLTAARRFVHENAPQRDGAVTGGIAAGTARG